MKRIASIALALLCFAAVARAIQFADDGTVPPGANAGSGSAVPSGFDIISVSQSACPAGYVEDTALAGVYFAGRPSGGAVGASLGTAMTGASPPDVSYTPDGSNGTVSFTPAGTNSTASFTPAGTNGTVSFTPAGTNSTASFTPAGTINTPTYSATGTKFSTSGSGTAALTALMGTTIASGTNTVTDTARTFAGTSGTVPSETFTGTAGTVPAETFTGTVGTVPAETFTGSPGTVPAQTFTGTPTTTMRSNVAPVIYVLICRKT